MEYVSEVYDYDRKQLTAYQETVQQVADLKDQLNAQLAEMEELKISYEDQASFPAGFDRRKKRCDG